jgi:hypothetical protein
MKLPRNLEAIVTESKLTGYLLSETHSVGRTKARYFRALGYSERNLVRLKEAVIAVAVTGEVAESISTPFGMKYVIDGDLDAPAGIRARVRTVWILESGEDLPRFVTAYPTSAEDLGVESD